MRPIVLIHGYSAESRGATPAAIEGIYGSLPKALRARYGNDNVVEINLSRWISLEDGIFLDDVSRALDRELRHRHPHLVDGQGDGFDAIVHSTGALVIRNWLRHFSPRPSPLERLIYLAGANFGSGWAHIGDAQFARWGRKVFTGNECGIRVLNALELGAGWTIDLHLHFLRAETAMAACYGVREFLISGTQADASWYELPIRYAKEDGSDGVVRVSSCNLNFNYKKYVPTEEGYALGFADGRRQLGKHVRGQGRRETYYRETESSIPGEGADGPALIPFAILNECAHSGDEFGIVRGSKPREQLIRLVAAALGESRNNLHDLAKSYDRETAATYQKAKIAQAPKWWARWITEPRAQYDAHSQVVLRLRDQHGRPVKHYDVFFDSVQGNRDPSTPIRDLIEHEHINGLDRNIIVFYLRTRAWDPKLNNWKLRVPELRGCFLEVTATEPGTGEIIYLPFRKEFTAEQLEALIQPHRTTIIDIELLRLPSDKVFTMVRK